MPEASKDAAILIATSYQALKRAENGDQSTEITNCMVLILFAGFFIEENLNVIIKEMKKETEMKSFLGSKRGPKTYPGLLDKIAWFYNSYIASQKAASKTELFKKDSKGESLILKKLELEFPGIKEIHDFRNKVAHGKIRTTNLANADKLRKQAKSIVDDLFKIAEHNGYPIMRNITYKAAIN
jgi:hypothetical protein